MTEHEPEDLAGTADERAARLEQLEAQGDVSAAWLRRQLITALTEWAAEDTELDIVAEARVDY